MSFEASRVKTLLEVFFYVLGWGQFDLSIVSISIICCGGRGGGEIQTICTLTCKGGIRFLPLIICNKKTLNNNIWRAFQIGLRLKLWSCYHHLSYMSPLNAL